MRGEANLPGTGDTVIKQAVPPGGDLALHLALLKPAIAQMGDSGAKFLVGGTAFAHPLQFVKFKNQTLTPCMFPCLFRCWRK